VETANETVAVTDVVSQAPHEMSFVGNLKVTSSSTRSSVRVEVRASVQGQSEWQGQSHRDGPIKL